MTRKQVRAIRKKLGDSRRQFAAKVGVSHRTVEAWENVKPPSKMAEKLILQLGK